MFAPDDRRILFATGVGVGVVGADGTEPPRIVARTECVAPPEPSPDARFFTCVAQRQVTLYPIDGGTPTTIQLDGAATTLAWQRIAG